MQVNEGALSQAQEILNMSPLPDDAEAQIEALEKQASIIEADMFADIYEALFTLQNA